VGVVSGAAHSMEFQVLPVLWGATAFDSAQQWKRAVLRLRVRAVVFPALGALGTVGVCRVLGGHVVPCALCRASLLAVFLLLGHKSSFG
jgi:hypothetical protein